MFNAAAENESKRAGGPNYEQLEKALFMWSIQIEGKKHHYNGYHFNGKGQFTL